MAASTIIETVPSLQRRQKQYKMSYQLDGQVLLAVTYGFHVMCLRPALISFCMLVRVYFNPGDLQRDESSNTILVC